MMLSVLKNFKGYPINRYICFYISVHVLKCGGNVEPKYMGECGRIHMNLVTLFTSEGGVGMDKKIYFSILCTV